MTKQTSVFFLSSEEKDSMSMAPVLEAVRKSHKNTHFVAAGFSSPRSDRSLSDIWRADYPIIVSSSPFGALRYMDLIRPRWSYYFLGIEHGLSPFKKFTYSDAFLVYDAYFAPSHLWKHRLEQRFPSARTRFQLGGYAKADELRQTLGAPPAPQADGSIRSVVVFSWGVKEEAFFTLPDLPGVTYLLHPAQIPFSGDQAFKHARVVRSAGGETERVLAAADRVFGDLSSLTFEAALCRPTWLFIERRFYVDDYDIDDAIMDPASADFARVPQTAHQIDRRFILSGQELEAALRSPSPPPHEELAGEQAFMAEIVAAEPGACARGILDVIHHQESAMSKPAETPHDVAALEFVQYAYRTILKREPDINGLKGYLELIRNSGQPASVIGMKILLQLLESKEASLRNSVPKNAWPKIELN